MKTRIIKITSMFLLGAVISACKEEKPQEVAMTGFKVSPTSITLVYEGTPASQQIIATAVPENATNIAFSWMSEDETVAAVSQTGLVTATGAGSTHIVVTGDNIAIVANKTLRVPVTVEALFSVKETSVFINDFLSLDFTLTVAAKIPIVFEFPAWIHKNFSETSIGEKTYSFTASALSEGETPRSGNIIIKPEDAENAYRVAIEVQQNKDVVHALLDGIFTGKTSETLDAENLGAAFSMHFPDFVVIGNEIWAYYIGTRTGLSSTGLAKSTDGINFANQGIVVEPTPGAWDATMTSFVGVWYDDGVFYLTYEGNNQSEVPVPHSARGIGLATSTDGINFVKQGMILEKTGTDIEASVIGTPDLYKEGDVWYLFYHAFDGYVCQICVAYGADLFNLTRAPNNPVIPTRPGKFDSGTTGRCDIIFRGGYYYMVYEVSTEMPYNTASWGHTFARSKDLLNWEILDKLLYPVIENGMGNDGPNWLVQGDDVYVYFRNSGNSTSRVKLVFNE